MINKIPSILDTHQNSYPELFKRYPNNPILTSKDWPYPVNTVFNPAATIFENKTLLLARVEDRKGFSHLTKALSEDGESNWVIDNKPTILAEPDMHPEEKWGIEDSRITWMPDLEKYAVIYTAFSRTGPLVSLALTTDFESFEKHGSIMSPDDKDAALFPRKFDGRYILIHRPSSGDHSAHIWISYSNDLKNWGGNQILLTARRGGWWDANKIGLSAQPLETSDGWLILYHGVKRTASGSNYRLGLALLDLENPSKVLRRSDEWVFGPEESYEKFGDVDNIVFPCGWIHDPVTGLVRMYYGGADSCIALATANMSDLLEYIKKCPEPGQYD